MRIFLLFVSALCFNIAPALEIHVSIIGSDTNSGSEASPFRTSGKANAVVSPGDSIILHSGTYAETLRPAVSGTEIAPIIYKAFKSGNLTDSVTITSFTEITANSNGFGPWQVHSGNIHKILLPESLVLPLGQNMVSLYEDPLREARWPNVTEVVEFRRSKMARADAGSIDLSSVVGTEYTGWYEDNDLISFSTDDWTGGYIQINAEQGWWNKSGLITDFSSNRVTFRWSVTNPSRETPSPDDPYYLSGRLVALDEAGEFFLDVNGLDGPANTLYVWLPDNADPAANEIGLKTRPNTADLSNREYIHLQDLSFLGGRILANNTSSHLRVERCNILYGAYDANLYDPWDGAARAALHFVGNHHIARDSNIFHSMTNGIVARSDSVEVSNCVVFNTWVHGINTDSAQNLTIIDNTVFNSGSTLISISGKASQFLRNHVFRGGQHITDIELMNTYDSGDALGTEIAWNWLHDNQAESEPLKRWNGGGGIRLDSGGSEKGCSNFVIHHNVIWDAGERGISIWALDPGMENYGAVDGAKVYVYNNTTDSNVGIRAGDDATGIHLINNLALDGIYFGSEAHASAANLSNNQHASLSDFLAPLGHAYNLINSSSAIDAGMAIPGITNGFQGIAPDIGAHEFGTDFPVPGARLLQQDLDNLQYTHKILHNGLSVIEVVGLPRGRILPDQFGLKLGDALILNNFYRIWDFSSGYFSAHFPFDYSLFGLSEISIQHAYDGISFTGAPQENLQILEPGIVSVSSQKLTIGEEISITGTSLYGYDHHRIPLVLPHLISDDLRLRPLPLRFDSSALIASGKLKADGSDLWFPVGDTGIRLQFAIESGWNTPYTLVWLRFPPESPSFRGENGTAYYLACGGADTPPGDQLSLESFFAYIDFSQIAFWLRPDSVPFPFVHGNAISQWSDLSGFARHAIQTETSQQPTVVLSPERPPSVQFDGVDDFLFVGDLSPSPGSFDSWTIYRTPNPSEITHQRSFSATPKNHPIPSQQIDYLGGLADLPERASDSTPVVHTNLHMTTLSKSGKYPENLVLGARSNGGNPNSEWFKGEISEILIFSENVANSVSDRIEKNYMAMKYGLEAWNGYFATIDTTASISPVDIALGENSVAQFSLLGEEGIIMTIPDLGSEAITLSLSVQLPMGSALSTSIPFYYYSKPYDNWRIDNFMALSGGPLGIGTGRNEDADSDGRNNFSEFAFDENPLSGTTGFNAPRIVRSSTQSQIEFTTGRSSSDVKYTIQFSNDMADWDKLTPITIPSETNAGVFFQIPLNPTSAAPVFTRIETVELN